MSSGVLLHKFDNQQGICGLLFGIAVLAAAARTIIRLQTKGHLAFNDVLLFVASMLLIVSAILFYKLVPGAYESNQIEYYPLTVLPPDLGPAIVYNTRILNSQTVISWSVIFTVKFCFLSFFRPLIDRVNHMITYWKFVVGMTTIFAIYSGCEIFIICPHVSILSSKFFHPCYAYLSLRLNMIRTAQCLQGPGFNRTFAVAISVMLLDIFTDLLSMICFSSKYRFY